MDCLVLHPADPLAAPEPRGVVAALAQLGLVAARPAPDGWHAPGPAFMELITFLGCSPTLATEGPAAIRILVGTPARQPRLRAGANTLAPRCPHCRHRAGDWTPVVRAWRSAPRDATWECQACGRAVGAAELDWRHAAGVARTFIDVRGVHPAEAVPGERLLAGLAAQSGGPWRFFYLRDEPA